jgi:hypothetical protein
MAPFSIVKEGALESFQPVKSFPLKSWVNPGSVAGVCIATASTSGARRRRVVIAGEV